MKCNKASDSDRNPANVCIHEGTTVVRHHHRVFLKIRGSYKVPEELIYASIGTIFKNDEAVPNVGTGISLLSVGGKIFAKVLLNRLQPQPERIFPEKRSRYRPERGTTDTTLSAGQVQGS